VCDVVLRLQKAGKTDEMIACLEAALVQGQSQPWMYTVLALAMEKAHRPRAEVERVLLSSVDYSAVNVSNLVYSAAFLTRFGANDRALELYRQAAKVDPTRIEPYVMGLRLARESHDPEAVEWTVTGILTRAWNKDHEKLHRDAEATALDLEAELRRKGREADADRLARALVAARQQDLVIELSWSGKADLDLLIEEPSGTVCSAENPSTTGGGVFVHDGSGADQNDTFDRYVCPRSRPIRTGASLRRCRRQRRSYAVTG
jgi:tetratricopeptide (TPR) repeat protein